MTGPIVALAYRYQRQLREARKDNRRLRAQLEALHATADTLQARWMEEREKRMDLELLHGWMEDA